MQLNPKSGQIYGHLFENKRTGLVRNLYWNISVDFEPISLLGENWDSSFQCDWLVWPIKALADLDAIGLDALGDAKLVEASLYLISQHHPISVTNLEIRRVPGNCYRLDAGIAVDVVVDGEKILGSFHLQCDLSFGGIIIIPENLDPQPSNVMEVKAAVLPFISLEGLQEPRLEGVRYVFYATR